MKDFAFLIVKFQFVIHTMSIGADEILICELRKAEELASKHWEGKQDESDKVVSEEYVADR